MKDIGFGITVSNNNSKDMLSLYHLAKQLNLEFATAAFHNSYYFHKYDNQITNKEEVISNFEKLIALQMKEHSPKAWFRAFFNNGLINYIDDQGLARCLSLQWLGGEVLEGEHGKYPWCAIFPGNMGKRTGGESPSVGS